MASTGTKDGTGETRTASRRHASTLSADSHSLDVAFAGTGTAAHSGAAGRDIRNPGSAAGAGDDTITVGIGSMTADGGAGTDRLIIDYSFATSQVYALGVPTDDPDGGYRGTYYIAGGSARVDYTSIENFTITSGTAGDALVTGDGDDVVSSGEGADTVVAGAGNDRLDGGAGIDALAISLADDTSGVKIDLTKTGAQQTGGAGSVTNFESFFGTVTGSAFADTLIEGRYDYGATFNLGAGNDTVQVSLGSDRINGEAGNDRLALDYSDATSQVYVLSALSADTAGGYSGAYYIAGGSARADFTGIENFTITSGSGDDTLVTGDGDDIVSTGLGNDTAVVGKGNDRANGGDGIDALSIDLSDEARGVTIDLTAGGAQQAGGTGSITNFESFFGTVTGSAGNDTLIEGRYAYNATFNLGAGNDTVQVSLGTDTINGEAGTDRLVADYSAATDRVYVLTPLTVDTAGGYQGTYYITGGSARADFTGIENFTITSGLGDDTLVTGDGNDVVSTGDGADQVTAGAGNDVLDGGDGVDVLSISLADDTSGVKIDLTKTGAQQAGGAGSITNFESFFGTVTGSAFADTLIEGSYAADTTFNLGAGADTVQVSLGTDTINGEAGNDRLVLDYSAATSQVYVLTPLSADPAGGFQGTYYISGGSARANFTGVENFTITSGLADDNLVTGDGDDIVATGLGNDTAAVGKGNDRANGGEGVDALSIDLSDEAKGVKIDLTKTGAQQTGGTGSITNFESFFGTVTGSAGNDTLIEGLYASNATFNLGAGNDTVQVSLGTDTINGDVGTDRLVADYSTATATVYVLNALSGSLADGYSGTFYISGGSARADFTGIENFTVRGGSANDTLTTADGSDELDGGAGNDTLTAAGGDDIVTGGAGDDTLNGGDGVDTASYADADSGVTVSLAVTGAQVTGGAGTDTLTGFENLTGSAFADTLTGDDNDNRIVGNGGADRIDGGAGDDKLYISATPGRIDGGAGSDLLYIVANSNVRIGNAQIAGIETVQVADGASLDLTGVAGGIDSIRSLSVAGGDVTIRGTNADDRIFGGAGADMLYGGAGKDRISVAAQPALVAGGAGIDILYVRGGASVAFDDTTLSGVERVYVLDGGSIDTSEVSTVFQVLRSRSIVGGGVTIVAGDGADFVGGGLGHDTLSGGAGDDRINIAAQPVRIDGGAGTSDVLLLGGTSPYVFDDTNLTGVERLVLRGGVNADLSAVSTAITININGKSVQHGSVIGTAGADRIASNDGGDTINGGGGADLLSGGAGADRFVFTALADTKGTGNQTDRILDFSHADRDKIDFSAIDADPDRGGRQRFTFIGTDAFSGGPGYEVRIKVGENGNSYIQFDTTHDGKADYSILVHSDVPLTAGAGGDLVF